MEESVGPCCVCGEEITFHEVGICEECGQPFCWSVCGGWEGARQCCENCREYEGE